MEKPKSRRGFASMDPEKQREIARKGGQAAHSKGTAHEFTSEEAREAGRKGGEAVSVNRAHMAEIGRKGGEARSLKSAKRREEQKRALAEQHANRDTGSDERRNRNESENDPSESRPENDE
jgi:uncharacterized protein